MRDVPDVPNGMMDFLFIGLMRGGTAQGYRQLNLEMASLSVLENGLLAPLWRRLDTAMFRHGEHFYNFTE
jgi:phosphatidylglycerol lysyltransferase